MGRCGLLAVEVELPVYLGKTVSLHDMKNSCYFIVVLLILMCTACGNSNRGVTQKSVEEETLKIYVFQVGEILLKDISALNSGETGAKLLTNSAYLIRHPKGDLLWDTGFADSLALLPEGLDSEVATIKVQRTLISQLDELQISPAEVEYLAISHLHPDHTGNANLFTNSTLLFQKEEYDSLFLASVLVADVSLLKENSFLKLSGDHDVFGDGSVIIKRAPGHTMGHQVLYVDLPETGPVVLSGDLFITPKQREAKGVPNFNVDKGSTLQSMDSIEFFIEKTGASLWIQHDLEQGKTRRLSPMFYQ